jgi:hypothetical protein
MAVAHGYRLGEIPGMFVYHPSNNNSEMCAILLAFDLMAS